MAEHRKQVRHDHEPGDLHELTFSCYQRKPLITNDGWRKLLCQSIDQAVERSSYRLIAFVLMPEHVHLLVLPTTTIVEVDRFLSAVKQPYSVGWPGLERLRETPVCSTTHLLTKSTNIQPGLPVGPAPATRRLTVPERCRSDIGRRALVTIETCQPNGS